MILRKPYALFIKYFKLLHVIMAVLILILLLRTFTLYRFFNTYLTSPEQALAAFTPESVLNIYSFFAGDVYCYCDDCITFSNDL